MPDHSSSGVIGTSSSKIAKASGSGTSSWKSHKKKYQPNFLKSTSISQPPQIPSIESFYLDNIVNEDLKDESQQVVNQLLNVAKNYKYDLRSEFERKLKIERRIQDKNLDIARLASSLRKSMAHKQKRLSKIISLTSSNGSTNEDGFYSGLEADIDQLLKLTIDNSNQIKSITSRLSAIDSKISHKKEVLTNPTSTRRNDFPSVHRSLQQANPSAHNEVDDSVIIEDFTNDRHLSISENYVDEDNGVVTKNLNEEQEAVPNHVTSLEYHNGNIDNLKESTIPDKDTIVAPLPAHARPSAAPEIENGEAAIIALEAPSDDKQDPHYEEAEKSNLDTPSKDDKQEADDEEQMDPEQFELFVSSSISKYRELQNKKYASADPFANTHNITHMNSSAINSGADIDRSPYHVVNNPINLLYSTLISNPKYVDSSPIQETKYPFSSMISIKSPATIKSTLQTSHFKKLRINGSPITSESFKKKKEKESSNQAEDDEDNESTQSLSKSASSSRKAITDSLLDTLRLGSSDEEFWNSSGLTTETETDGEEDEDMIHEESGTEEDQENHDDEIEDEAEFELQKKVILHRSGPMSSESSDTDSSEDGGSNEASIASTNEYYNNLKSGLLKKKKNLITKRSDIIKSKKRDKKYSVYSKESSPTPKHKPSHHILKPKRSILKTISAPRSTRITTAKVNNQAFLVEADAVDGVIDERNALSSINNAFDSKRRSSIDQTNANGLILSISDLILDHDAPNNGNANGRGEDHAIEEEVDEHENEHVEYEGGEEDEIRSWNGSNSHAEPSSKPPIVVTSITKLKNLIS